MHVVRIETFEQFVKAIGVLEKVGGTYHGAGSSSDRRLIVTDLQFQALVDAKVIANSKKEKAKSGKKKTGRKTKS